ncbi:MAG: phosphate ABC transporter permease subunit PstC [Acidimicrobiales bacterium]|nr:phosphate ABC transporter permease subunit PstC [Acidimicrobiales bacterium]
MSDVSLQPPQLQLSDHRGDPRRVRTEAIVKALLTGAAGISIAISAAIVWSLAREAFTFVTQVEWSTVLVSDGWFPRQGVYDIRTLIVGTLWVTVIAMAVAGPIGLGAAIYLSEYARPNVRKTLKPVLEVLAGIPSVVLGFFAVSVIAPSVVQRFTDAGLFSVASAGIAVGILSIPLVASVSEDALRSVPSALREAGYGLGAKKITTVTTVVLPAAVSGLVAAFILAVSRAIGETMVVFIAAGAAGNQAFEVSPTEPGLTLTAAMATQAQGTDQVVGEALTFQSLYFVGAVLFILTLVLNLLADRFVRRVRQAY